MSGDILDLSKAIKPIIIDPGKNEWVLKERNTPGIGKSGIYNKFFFISPITETEFLAQRHQVLPPGHSPQ